MEGKNEGPDPVAADAPGFAEDVLHHELSNITLNWPRPGNHPLMPPPAFQEYGNNMLANEDYRAARLDERGLLFTMRLECWANGTVPADSALLASVLHITRDGLTAALTERVLRFFRRCAGRGERLYCPELAAYMRRQLCDRQKSRDSGREGGKKSASLRRGKKP